MKAFILVVLVGTLVYVNGETCSVHNDCKTTGCSGIYHLECVNGQCRCVIFGSSGTGSDCTTVSDCSCDQNHHAHCFRHHCLCTRF